MIYLISFEVSTSVKLAAYSHSAADSPRKVKVQSSPTTHVTETSFLHDLDPPDHFALFAHIHNLDYFNKFTLKTLDGRNK